MKHATNCLGYLCTCKLRKDLENLKDKNEQLKTYVEELEDVVEDTKENNCE